MLLKSWLAFQLVTTTFKNHDLMVDADLVRKIKIVKSINSEFI